MSWSWVIGVDLGVGLAADRADEALAELGLTASNGLAMVGSCTTAIDRERLVRSPDVTVSASPTPVVEKHFKQFIFIRSDLGDYGFAGAQIAHASGESAVMHGGPLPRDMHVGIIAVPSEGALRDISRKLTARGIEHALIEEPDEPWCGQATAIGVRPTRDHRSVHKVSSHLPRYK